jgi:hypothetical protein
MGKIFLSMLTILALALIVTGMVGDSKTDESNLKELSIGIIILGIGLIGMLKIAIEMFENHRLDKQVYPGWFYFKLIKLLQGNLNPL